MSDLIDRQAAIEALRRAEALTRAFGYHNVIDTIRELPSVQPEEMARDIATIIENEKDMRVILANGQTGWIPVTEALPENGHYYLKCTKYGNVDVDYYWDGFENATKYGEEIVAWMEKPKPYKGRQDGTT